MVAHRLSPLAFLLSALGTAALVTGCSGGADASGAQAGQDLSGAAAASATPAAATVILTSAARLDDKGQLVVTGKVGFEDSTFDADTKSYCYVGKAADVCGLVKNYAVAMDQRHDDGDHDDIQLGTCKVDGATATVTYEIDDDFGGDAMESRVIGACEAGGSGTSAGTFVFTASAYYSALDTGAPVAIHDVSSLLGFEDSTFDSDTKAFCYVGDATKVCAQLKSYATATQTDYANGGHEELELSSCKTDAVAAPAGTTVTFTYKMSDDYGGDRTTTRTLATCAVNAN